jgi:hypothetical protein
MQMRMRARVLREDAEEAMQRARTAAERSSAQALVEAAAEATREAAAAAVAQAGGGGPPQGPAGLFQAPVPAASPIANAIAAPRRR